MNAQRNTFSLLFMIRKYRTKSNGEAPIYLRITVNNKQLDMSLHRSVAVELWDIKEGKVKGNGRLAKSINNFLFSVKASIYENYKELKESKKHLTPIDVKNAYLGIEEKQEEKITLINLFQEHNDDLEKRIGVDYSKSTVTKYKTTLKHIKSFIRLKYGKDDINIEDVNNIFVTGYESYLKVEKQIGHNTVMKYETIFKKIIKIAMANDWLKKDPFTNYKISVKPTERPFLTEEELNTLINKKFKLQRLELVKDSFLFSCFTGLAHSDLKKLTQKDIKTGTDGNKWVMINRTKTDSSSHIPVLPITAMLIEKYKDNPYCLDKGVLLPVLTNQKMNAYLKEIADVCGIDKNLTSHIARHTFATTVTLNNDVPIETVSKMLGHSSIKMTKIHAKLLDKKVGRDMAHLQDKFSMVV